VFDALEGSALTGSPFRAEVVSAPDSVMSGAEAEVRVRLHVPAEHWVYAERTNLEVPAQPGVERIDVRAPESETKHDPFLEKEVQVYKHDAQFVARVRVGWPTKLQLVMTSQGCSSTICFLPQSDTLIVSIGVIDAPAVKPELAPVAPSTRSPRA
jgi:thiol:disulfide interchange protein